MYCQNIIILNKIPNYIYRVYNTASNCIILLYKRKSQRLFDVTISLHPMGLFEYEAGGSMLWKFLGTRYVHWEFSIDWHGFSASKQWHLVELRQWPGDPLGLAAIAEIVLGMGSANERRRYFVTSSLIGWAHSQNDLCIVTIASSTIEAWGDERNRWSTAGTFCTQKSIGTLWE